MSPHLYLLTGSFTSTVKTGSISNTITKSRNLYYGLACLVFFEVYNGIKFKLSYNIMLWLVVLDLEPALSETIFLSFFKPLHAIILRIRCNIYIDSLQCPRNNHSEHMHKIGCKNTICTTELKVPILVPCQDTFCEIRYILIVLRMYLIACWG